MVMFSWNIYGSRAGKYDLNESPNALGKVK